MRPAKLSAANAEPRNPASVMPTCIVDRNVVGASAIFKSSFARRSPAAASRLSRLSFSEMTAISVAAKKALIEIRNTCNSN